MLDKVLLGNTGKLRCIMSIRKLLHFLFIQPILLFLFVLLYSTLIYYVAIALFVCRFVIGCC